MKKNKLPKILKNLKNNKAKCACMLMLPITVSCLCMQILVANRYAVKGEVYTELLTQKSQLESEISKMSLEKYKLSSLALVQKRAKDLGFVSMESSVIALGPVSVAVATSY